MAESDQSASPAPSQSKISDSDPPSSSSVSTPSESSPQSSPSPLRWISSFAQNTFIESLPSNFRSRHEDELIKIFRFYIDKIIDPPEFELAIMRLIKKVPGALDGFKKLLPTANIIPSPSKKGRTFFIREICTFNDKVRAGLYDDTDNYMLWLEHLIEYKDGTESFPEFKRNVEPHFVNMADLWMDFDAKFAPKGDGDTPSSASRDAGESNQDSISGGAPSDSSDSEPASKRSKIE